MKYRTRCTVCRLRHSFGRVPLIDEPCKRDGCHGFMRIDKYRQSGSERNKQGACNCDGYWFPHRPGGGACRQNESAERYEAERYNPMDYEPGEIRPMTKPYRGWRATLDQIEDDSDNERDRRLGRL